MGHWVSPPLHQSTPLLSLGDSAVWRRRLLWPGLCWGADPRRFSERGLPLPKTWCWMGTGSLLGSGGLGFESQVAPCQTFWLRPANLRGRWSVGDSSGKGEQGPWGPAAGGGETGGPSIKRRGRSKRLVARNALQCSGRERRRREAGLRGLGRPPWQGRRACRWAGAGGREARGWGRGWAYLVLDLGRHAVGRAPVEVGGRHGGRRRWQQRGRLGGGGRLGWAGRAGSGRPAFGDHF